MPVVHVVMADGTTGTVPEDQLGLMPPGTKVTGGSSTASTSEESGGLLGQVAAGILGAGSTATLGATDKLAREIPYILGGPEASREVTSQLRMVRERNPGSTIAGEVGGLLLNPEAISGAGEAAAAPIAARAGEGLLANIATHAVRTGAETALMGAQHEVTEESLGDHDLNAQAIWSQAGKEGLLGAGLGGGLGLLGGLGSKAARATGLLARRSGPLSGALLDEVAADGVEGAGKPVRDYMARGEKTIAELRATGATADQAADIVTGLEDAARTRVETAPVGKDLADWAADSFANMHGAKNPERAAIMRQHYADTLKPLEDGTGAVDRRALEMSKAGTAFMRDGNDVANNLQFQMKPDRFAKFVDTSLVDTQADQVARIMQNVDTKLTEIEGLHDKGGIGAGAARLRNQWKAVNESLLGIATGGSEKTSRDMFVQMNTFKQMLDSYVPYGRASSYLIDGKAIIPGLPSATRDIAELGNQVRTTLEDTSVWGDAGARQARENATYSAVKPRFDHFVGQVGESIDQAHGARIPEIDYKKVRGVLDQITGNPEIDEALQPIKSARATIEGLRDRITALREGGEISERDLAKFASAERNITTFESSLNGAMKEAALANRLKAARIEESGSGVGGILGIGLDTITRPLKTTERIAHVKLTANKVLGSIKSAFRDVADAGGSSTEGLAAREAAPRPREKIIEEMQSIRSIANNPAALESAAARMVGDLSGYAPQTANALRLTAMRALIYLAREAPPASVSSNGAFGAPQPRYSDIQIHDWEDKRNAAFNPADVVTDMKHGRLNRESITAAKYVAPQLYAEMQNLARDQIAAMSARGELDRMPYQQMAVISALLEVPADRTFEPDFMAMMQAAKAQSAAAAPSAATSGAQPVKKSNQKPMADMYMTASGQIEAGGTTR